MLQDFEIKKIIKEMSIDMKVGQLFLLAYPGKDPGIIKPLIKKYGISGCYISQDNAENFSEATKISRELQSYAFNRPYQIPMILAVDQEGAWGVLVPESHTGPGNLALGATADLQLTSEMYRVFGEEMLSVGYNTLLSPCADVNSNPYSPIIGTRSFGQFPSKVAEHVVNAIKGAKKSQILTTLKHFPGHGATSADSHRELPEVDKSLNDLLASDLLPFQKGIEAGADIVMTSHIKYPQLDNEYPATLSSTILQGLLREYLGFDGIILSDSMNMGAIRNYYEPAESTLKALQAGVDIVMLSEEHYDHDENYLENQLKSLELVKKAIIQGELPIEVVDEKLMRILKLKFNKMLIKKDSLDKASQENNLKIQQQCAKKAITLISDKHGHWPVNMQKSVVCINSTPRKAYSNIYNFRGIGPNQRKPAFDFFKEELKQLSPEVTFIDSESISASTEICNKADTILLITEDYPLPGEDFPKGEQQSNVRKVLQQYGDKVIIIGLRSAYELIKYPNDVTYVSTFSSRGCSAIEMAKLLVKGDIPSGKSPITV